MNNKGGIINFILIIVTIVCAVFLGILVYSGLTEYLIESETSQLIINTTNETNNTTAKTEVVKNTVENYNVTQIEPVEPTVIVSNNSSQNVQYTIHRYFYNQLDEYSKIIYGALETNLENLKTGTYKIQFGNEFDALLKQENGSEILNNRFQVAWDAFYYDRPDVFYLDATKFSITIETTTKGLKTYYKVYIDNGQNVNYLQEPYTNKEQINLLIKELENLRIQFKEQMLVMSTKQEQIKALHDWIVDNVEYDSSMQSVNRYTINGALQDRIAVCEGYAKLFKYILDSVEIENVLVSGTAINSEGESEKHMWNYVQLDGVWYGVDCTWDDPIIKGNGKVTEQIKYKYFLKGKEVFDLDHKTEPITQNNTVLKYPEL